MNNRVPIPRDHPNVLDDKSEEFFNFENRTINYEDESHYEIRNGIGDGFSSDVFEGLHKPTKKEVILKLFKNSAQALLIREYEVLRMLADGPNIVQCLGVTRFQNRQRSALVLEVLDQPINICHTSLRKKQVRVYAKQILEGLDFCHKHGIIHFDIKPSNIMINRVTKVIKLIDFGSAFLYRMHTPFKRAACTLAYMAPEILLKYQYFNYAVDMWAFACVLGEMIFCREPFLNASDKNEQMTRIVEMLSIQEFAQFLSKYSVRLCFDRTLMLRRLSQVEFKGLIDDTNSHLAGTDAVNLIQSILQFDPEQRLTASEALQHKYFSDKTTCVNPIPGPSTSK